MQVCRECGPGWPAKHEVKILINLIIQTLTAWAFYSKRMFWKFSDSPSITPHCSLSSSMSPSRSHFSQIRSGHSVPRELFVTARPGDILLGFWTYNVPRHAHLERKSAFPSCLSPCSHDVKLPLEGLKIRTCRSYKFASLSLARITGRSPRPLSVFQHPLLSSPSFPARPGIR